MQPMLRTTLLPLACAAALVAALPPPAVAQTTSTPADDSEALHNIQSNFAHMTPPPRSVASINKDLQQAKAAPVNRQGGGRGGKGRMRQQQQQDNASPDTKPQAAQDVPAPSANPQPSAAPATTP
ncbi:signal peptidase [Ralstonia insidiosa]